MSEKGMPLTKEEVKKLIELIAANPVVFSKATNASNNKLKEAAWYKITDHFNSVIASCPRKPEQLRLKWENLKKVARKRSSLVRMNILKTGGGKSSYIPPDDTLDAVAGLLGLTCDGKWKRQAVNDALKNSIILRNKAISQYFELKSRMLELEILEMERKLCHSSKKGP